MSARELTCDRCSTRFGCAVDDPAGCWCAVVPLTAACLADLRARYGDCLCASCLREFADEKKAGADDSDRPSQ